MTAPLVLLPLLVAQPADVREVRVGDGNGAIVLKADGTAERSYRGLWDKVRLDEPVGVYRAKLPPREFGRVAALPGVTGFDGFKDGRVAFPSRIAHFTLVRGTGRKTLEWHSPRSERDAEQPDELWTLDAVVRGVASRLDWEPIPGGVRVRFAGPSEVVREVMVREEGTNYPVAGLRSHRAEVLIPCRPGRYSVEMSTLVGGHWTERVKTPVVVEADRSVEVRGR